jgi:hypothetical protein
MTGGKGEIIRDDQAPGWYWSNSFRKEIEKLTSLDIRRRRK